MLYENSVFLTFKKSLFEINHSLIFCNSLFTVGKRTLMSLCSRNRFVSSTNIIVFNKSEALGRSFTYIKNTTVITISKDRSLRYSACYFLFICLVVIINANILLSICWLTSKPGKICTRSQTFSKVLYDRLYQTPLKVAGS